MKLVTIEIEGETYAKVEDGKPVYLDGDKEVAFDAVHTSETIKRLNGEAKGHREARQTAEKALAAFEGIEDPAAAIKAMQTVQNLDAKKLVDAGEVEKVKAEAIKAVEDKYKPVSEERDTLKKALHQEKIGGKFARSKFISEKLAVPVQMVEATFGRHFDLVDGEVIAKDGSGNQIYSKSRPGEPADFDEALEAIVDGSPYRDQIMGGRRQSGSGANGGADGSGKGAKTISRAEFDKINASDPARAAKMVTADGISVTD